MEIAAYFFAAVSMAAMIAMFAVSFFKDDI